MKTVILQFPGSNCDQDALHAAKTILKEAEFVWHTEKLPKDTELIFIPGGFSYGDHLRSGAIAAMSPIMQSIKDFANNGGYVIGVCNGFQILTESGLLEGALSYNKNMHFICDTVEIQVVNNKTVFSSQYLENQIIKLPIAHGEGNYYAPEAVLQQLEDNKQIVFRYVNNLNGSLNNIAGIINKNGNVLGMMPHPERAIELLLGNDDGKKLFESLLAKN